MNLPESAFWETIRLTEAERDEARAERDHLSARLARIDALFAGGPDTPCRTTHPDGIECVEVPMDDLRAALADVESGDDMNAATRRRFA